MRTAPLPPETELSSQMTTSTTSNVFFFSSRRRHTIFDCDWSSDVWSSDLAPMTNENKAIEQLWYTWPDVGIITAGFHIRAASAGLQDFRSDLIRRLDLYQRYSLPGDADRSRSEKLGVGKGCRFRGCPFH